VDADCDGEPVPDGDPAAVGDPAAEVEPDGAGDAGVRLGLPLGLELDGAGVGELEDGVGVGELEDGDGLGVGELEDGDGVGVGVLVAGSTWHLVSVLALAPAGALGLAEALALAEVPGLGEAAASRSALARAVPGRPASTPRARNPQASTLSIAARTCASRMKNALVSATHSGLLSARRGFGGD
jgi:hypothetical protein